MTHISVLQAEGTHQRLVHETARATRLRAWRGLVWPVNEVVLTALVRTGKTREEIATLYAVAPERVDALRAAYEV
jgi:hypothetical protein